MSQPLPVLVDRLAACLRGERVVWHADGSVEQLIAACDDQGITALIHAHEVSGSSDWPEAARVRLSAEARAGAVQEVVRGREVTRVLSGLAALGVNPILFKGTPLAYTVYDRPAQRPRNDTDLLVLRDQTDTIRSAMSAMGYAAATCCDGDLLFCQFELARADAFGITHAFDFHWKISTQSLFANMLTFEELALSARAVPALGPAARTAGPLHALLLSCLHPVMHHRNEQRLIWMLDVHKLLMALGEPELARFADLAVEKRVATICRHGIASTAERFGTPTPPWLTERLTVAEGTEPSAVYLRPGRRWHHELASNLQALPRLRDRLGLLREIVFPSAAYMRSAYGVAGTFGAACLPALYLYRGAHGAWKVLSRRK
jgi:hypothetical protein